MKPPHGQCCGCGLWAWPDLWQVDKAEGLREEAAVGEEEGSHDSLVDAAAAKVHTGHAELEVRHCHARQEGERYRVGLVGGGRGLGGGVVRGGARCRECTGGEQTCPKAMISSGTLRLFESATKN